MKFGNAAKSKYIIILAHLAALVTMGAWGTSFLSTKVLMESGGMTPVEVYIYRFAAAYLILLCFTWRHIRSHGWRDELTLAVSGVCAGSLYFIAENYALRLTSTGNVSLLASISPIFTTILMAVFYRQRTKLPVWVGSIIAFTGAGCIVFSHGGSLEFSPVGDLIALSAAFSWGVYSVAIKRILPLYSSFFITRKMFFYGVLTALPLLLAQQEPYNLSILWDFSQPKYLTNFLFLVLFCSIAAYLLWNEVMKYLGPVMANNYLYAQPIVTMIAAYFVFGENVTLLGYVGCGLIIGGLIISDKMKDGVRLRRQ